MLPRKLLVTAANRGIGLSTLQALATRSPSHHYLLATRSMKNGDLAIQELRKSGVQAEMDVVDSDVAGEASIKAKGRKVRKQYERYTSD